MSFKDDVQQLDSAALARLIKERGDLRMSLSSSKGAKRAKGVKGGKSPRKSFPRDLYALLSSEKKAEMDRLISTGQVTLD